LLKKLGPYLIIDKDNSNQNKIIREKRPVVILENGAKYDGEWDIKTNMRHGIGS
jgi:hypothetical protein